MTIPMWLIVLMVLFAALGVWAMIFFFGVLFRMIDQAVTLTKKKDNGNPTV